MGSLTSVFKAWGVQWCLWGRMQLLALYFIPANFSAKPLDLNRDDSFHFSCLWMYRQANNETLCAGPLHRKLIHWQAWPFNDYFYLQFVILSRLVFLHSASPRRKTNQHFHTLRRVHEFWSKTDSGTLKFQARNTPISAAEWVHVFAVGKGSHNQAAVICLLEAWGERRGSRGDNNRFCFGKEKYVVAYLF